MEKNPKVISPLYKNDYKCIAIEEFNSCNPNIESLFVKLTNTAAPITVGTIYRPPNYFNE